MAMKLLGKVTKVLSGSEYTDRRQRVEIKVKDAPWGTNELRVPNEQGLQIDQAVTVSIEPLDEDDEF